jgi:hypothetical protein
MLVSTIFKIENEILNLENNIAKLKSLSDPLTFRIIINESIKMMLLIGQLTKNKNDLFGKKIPIELLTNIFSFLPYDQIMVCQGVCITWFKDLKKMQAVISIKPKISNLCGILDLGFTPMRMIKVKKNIYVISHYDVCKIDTNDFKLISDNNMNFYMELIASNDNYMICYGKSHTLNIFSFDLKFKSRIVFENLCGVAIDNKNNIYISTNNKFKVYNIEGDLTNSWDLVDNSLKGERFRKIAVDENWIYISDYAFNCINKFSFKGKLIKSWGKLGSGSGDFFCPWEIKVYKNFVFVVDTGNLRIQVFDCDGNFICEHKKKNEIGISDFVIIDGCLFITNQYSNNMEKYKLIFN